MDNNSEDQNNQNVQTDSGTSETDVLQSSVENLQNDPAGEHPETAPQQNPENTQVSNQPQSQPIQPQETPGVSSTPNVSKTSPPKILIIGLILLFIALVIGAVYLISQNKKPITEKPTTDEQVTTQSASDTTTKTITDSTLNWKTYTNKYFSVKYPSDLISGGGESLLNISKWGPTQTEGTELFDGFAVNFILKEIPNTSPEEYAETLIAESESMGVSKITEGPTAIILNTYKGVTYTEEGLGTFKQIVLGSDDDSKIMVISYIVADPGNLGFQETVDQILSTFEFISGV